MKVTIITNMNLERFRKHETANLGLIWGLEARGIEWETLSAATHRPVLDPDTRAVFSWWDAPWRRKYRMRFWHSLYGRPTPGRVSRLSFERRILEQCEELGIPLVNPFSARRQLRHSYGLRRWKEEGIPCADFEIIEGRDDITLEPPLIVRTDGGSHSTKDSFLAHSQEDLDRIFAVRAESDRSPLTLAIQFLPNVYSDGLYRKRRSFIIGDQIVTRQQLLSENWKVKLCYTLGTEQAVEEDRRFHAEGEEEEELVIRAGRALGADVMALDYTRTEEGSYLFWEANPKFGMAGLGDGKASRLFRAGTGKTKEDCREEHVRFGIAIADLILQRIEEHKNQAA